MLKQKILVLVLLAGFLFGGCTPLFFKENKPVIINEKTEVAEDGITVKSEKNLSISIDNINNKLAQGIVWDMSRDGERLLVSNYVNPVYVNNSEQKTPQVLGMGLYDFQTAQFNPLLYSNKNQLNGSIDYQNKGYLYLENMETNADALPRFRLIWSDLEGSSTRSISSADENASPGYSMVNDNLVVYGNQKGEIKLVQRNSQTQSEPTIRTYQLSKRLAIYQVELWEEENMVLFGAYDNGTSSYNLYLASLTKQNPEPVLIQQNIFFFDFSPEQGKLLYSTSGDKEMQRLVLYDLKNSSHHVLVNGYLGTFAFTQLGDKVVYSERVNSSSSSQNLWIMDPSGSDPIQMASNVNIYGYRFVFHPYRSTIYFTVFNINNEGQEDRQITYNVYSIDYSVD